MTSDVFAACILSPDLESSVGIRVSRGTIAAESMGDELKLVRAKTNEATRREHQFADFYNTAYNKALAFVQVRTVGYCDQESIVGDAFTLVWSELVDTGQLPSQGWLFGVLRNKIGDLYRRWETERNTTLTLPDVAQDHSDQVVDSTDARRMLERLPEDYRDVLYLTYWLDLSAPTVAEALGISPGAVRVRLTRARAVLKAKIDNPTEEVS